MDYECWNVYSRDAQTFLEEPKMILMNLKEPNYELAPHAWLYTYSVLEGHDFFVQLFINLS